MSISLQEPESIIAWIAVSNGDVRSLNQNRFRALADVSALARATCLEGARLQERNAAGFATRAERPRV